MDRDYQDHQDHQDYQITEPTLDDRVYKIVKVPGNLTCLAHALILSFLHVAEQNPSWFRSIKTKFDNIVRHIYDVNGTFECYEIRTHLLREFISEYVDEKGQDFFRQHYGNWYWGNEVSSNIVGRNHASKEKPEERAFIEYAEPCIMAFSIIFDCHVSVILKNGHESTFSPIRCNGPTIYISSNMDPTKNHSSTHFDALLPIICLDKWITKPNVFTELGPVVMFGGVAYRDIISRIDKFYIFLGHRYQDVLLSLDKEEKAIERKAEQVETDRLVAQKMWQEEQDAIYAASL